MRAIQQGLWKRPHGGRGLIPQAWRLAEPLVVAALSAHVAIVALTDFVAPVPLATALVATLIFAAILLAYAISRRRSRERVSTSPILSWTRLSAAGLAFLCIWAGARLVGVVMSSAQFFYCHPAVPWRVDIALFGSFASGYLITMADARGRARLVYPMTMVAFLWIAPFYGFFSAPVFLAVSLNTACADRELVATIIAAFGMIVGDRIGAALAQRVSGRMGTRD